jgi:hypothetical protein
MSMITQTCTLCKELFSCQDLTDYCGRCSRYKYMSPDEMRVEADKLEFLARWLKLQASLVTMVSVSLLCVFLFTGCSKEQPDCGDRGRYEVDDTGKGWCVKTIPYDTPVVNR